MRNFLIKIISTFFYIGNLKLIPGTCASITAVLLYYLTADNFQLYIWITFGVTVLGFLVSGKAEKIFQQKDAKCIVIDEVSGMLLSLYLVHYDIRLAIISFLLFRILDITKPYPANKIQNLGGSIGIMGDDIIAAVYTNIILQILSKFVIKL